MSTRFAPRGPIDPNSKAARIATALRCGLNENDVERFDGYMEQLAQRGGSAHGPTTAMLQVLGELADKDPRSTAAAPALTGQPKPVPASAPSPATQQSSHVSTPKPMPVPSRIEAMGPAAVQGYRDGWRAENARCLRLMQHPATQGRHIALGKLLIEGLDDQQIFVRLPQEPNDTEQRARMRQEEISATWDRAIARAFGQPAPTAFSSEAVGNVWDRAIAANNPGHNPADSTSSASSDVWDRVYARVFTKN